MTRHSNDTPSPVPSASGFSWRAVFQLIRLPNCFTAIPDIWAGFFIAQFALFNNFSNPAAGEIGLFIELFTAALIGFLAYAGGVALNDVCDRAYDRVHRPERPLPSGRVYLGDAVRLVAVCALASIWLAFTFSVSAAVAVGAVWGLIVLYNLVHKRIPALGLPVMGLTRGANATAGLVIGSHTLTPELIAPGTLYVWVFPGVLALYVLSISVVARLEKRFQLAVKAVPRMILGIALLDAGIVLIVTGWPLAAVAVAVWIIPAWGLSRRFAMS